MDKHKTTASDPKEIEPSPKTNKVKKVQVEKLENSSSNEIEIEKVVEVETYPVKEKEKVEAAEASPKVNKKKLETQTSKASSIRKACLQVTSLKNVENIKEVCL